MNGMLVHLIVMLICGLAFMITGVILDLLVAAFLLPPPWLHVWY